MLDLTKPVRTLDGREVRIYATDGEKPFPVHGAVFNGGGWEVRTWTSEGRLGLGRPEVGDLVNAPKKFRKEGWVNVYRDGARGWYTTKGMANIGSSPERIACLKIVVEGDEGEGLEGNK